MTAQILPPPSISVLVVNYNAGQLLAECMDGLRQQTFGDFEVLVVDNGSVDGSINLVPSDDLRFSTILPGSNLGFAKGNNLAASRANGRWIATLNPDAVPRSDWLSRLIEATRRHPDTVMFGSLQLSAEDQGIIDGAGDCYSIWGIPWRGGHGHRSSPPTEDMEVFGPCAAAALYRTDVFREAEGFDPDFFCYCEDVDLAFRLRLSGYNCVQVADAVVLHHGSALSGRTSDFTMFHSSRNRLWTFLKNMPGPLLWLAAPLFIAANGWLLFRHSQMGCFLPLWNGLMAGLRGVGPMFAKRRAIQRKRCRSILDLALQDIAWSPSHLSRRSIRGRPCPRERSLGQAH